MHQNVNLVFGGSGLIGSSLKKRIKSHKNFIFISKNKKNFFNFDLNKDMKNFPYKKVNKCFFFASPRILNKNLKKEIFHLEFEWLKKVIQNIKINKLIYLSSSSVYYSKKHIVGLNKKKCEKFILNNKKKFINYQIWRPFNLVGLRYNSSDHFYNILFKKMFIEKKNFYLFKGNINDKRGYSSVDEFTKVMIKYSSKKKNFIKDFGNPKVVKIIEIINLFNERYFKLNNKYFKFKFLSKKSNVSKIKQNKYNIFSKTNSISLFKIYLGNSLNVKKV